MKLGIFLLADYANGSGGRLNIMGVFNTIAAEQFPAQHPFMFLVAKVEAELGEQGKEHRFTLLRLDEDSNASKLIEDGFTIPEPAAGYRSNPHASFIFQLIDIPFEKPSLYEFRFLVDDHPLGSVHLDVVQRERTPQGK